MHVTVYDSGLYLRQLELVQSGVRIFGLSRARSTRKLQASLSGNLPPNFARIGYTTEGALFISTQLSTDAVSALRKVWVLVRLWNQPIVRTHT